MKILSSQPVQIIKAGLAYFALVFGAGFLLGAIRVPFMVPRLGERMAELIEMPFTFVIILLSARFIAKRFALAASTFVRLAVGFLALGLALAAEVLLAVAIQNQSIAEFIASRDPVSGSVFLGMLLLFALMPLIVMRSPSGLAHNSDRK
ncbi:MAG: hypothetical protein ABL859_07960 [Methylotenera sp.]